MERARKVEKIGDHSVITVTCSRIKISVINLVEAGRRRMS